MGWTDYIDKDKLPPTMAEVNATRRATQKGKPAVLAREEQRQSRLKQDETFRKAVWTRDKGRCRATGVALAKSGLDDKQVGEVDHALLRSTAPDKVFDVENGVLLQKFLNRLRKRSCVRAPQFRYFDYTGPADRGKPQKFVWRDDDGKITKTRHG